jgi:hypothetical protein
MRRKGLSAGLLALLCIFLLSACEGGPGASAVKLVAGYYGAPEADIAVLGTGSYGGGHLIAAMYSDNGSHLALFKTEKNGNGKDIIAAVSEGTAGMAGKYFVNILTDGGKTILFGDLGGIACSKISFTFDDGTVVSEPVGAGNGYVVIAGGSLKVKDFTLYGAGGTAVGGYQEFLKAGGSIIRAGFVPVEGK